MKMKNVEEIYPLSPLQQGILFHALYAPKTGVYYEQLSCTLRGEFCAQAFQDAWQQVLDRHPILRTAFIWEQLDEPLQVVRKQVTLPWQFLDWQSLDPSTQTQKLDDFLESERVHDFVLTQAPLLRISLIQLAADRHVFVWGFHHLLLDGWCMPLLLNEVFQFYEANCRGKTLNLPTPRPYRDYIAWLKKQDLGKAERYWKQNLAGFSAPTALAATTTPAQNEAEPSAALHYEESLFSLEGNLSRALQELAQRQHLTVSTLVQGAWALLLSQYSGTDDVLFGATVSGRPPALLGMESMVGLFINTLPVRVRIDPQLTFADWLQQLQQQHVEREQFSYTPLVKIQGWSEVARGVSLFDSLLIFENYPIDSALQERDSVLDVTNIRFDEQTNYPLTLLVLPGSELQLRFSFNPQLLDSDSIQRIGCQLQAILQAMTHNPQQRLADLTILTEAERQQVLVDWNRTEQPYPQEMCLHQLFEAQAMRTPDAIAVVFEDRSLTYHQLDVRANQLAHYLQNMGVAPETLVAIALDRSLEMVVGLLGILKAGAAYVPLDPAFPTERLALMLEDSQASVLVTSSGLVEQMPHSAARILCLDRDWEFIAQASTATPTCRTTSANRAYVLYTSGSTGRPKGVQIAHRSVVNFLLSMQREPGIQAQDKLLAVTTLSFDIAALELYLPLLVGAQVVIASRTVAADGAQLLNTLTTMGITIMQATPATWRLLLAVDWQGDEHLRMICGGEALPGALAQQLLGKGKELWNLYGPTETTIWSSAKRVLPTSGSAQTLPAVISIGRPIDNTQFYILNAQMQPVPVAVQGELYIGGDGLALGYLNRPDLTQERFVPNPFATLPTSSFGKERLYKTGDLARYLPNGDIEYLGRIDNQVKVRGFRIELGEVEAALTQHPWVAQAVVVARPDASGEQRLVGYWLPQTESQQAALQIEQDLTKGKELRLFLQEKLPSYMVPNIFVQVQKFPLTPNGKIDRNALPAPDQVGASSATTYLAPRTPTEQIMAGIWAEVLGVETVGIQDDFFVLGGHSLLATQVVSRLRATFQVEIPLQQLFSRPTIATLAEFVESATRGGQSQQQNNITAVDRTQPQLLSFAQQRLWFLEQLGGASGFYNMPFALRLRGLLNHRALEDSFTTIIARHETLRTRFVIQDNQVMQRIDSVTNFHLQWLDWATHSPLEQQALLEKLIGEEDSRPFDLSQQQPLRALLIRMSDEEHVLHLVLHHIVADGWSIGVLVRELSAIYQSLSNELPLSLPPLTIQYADYAAWQRQTLNAEMLEAQVGYWQRQLAGAPPLLELPSDRPRAAIQNYVGGALDFRLEQGITLQLKRLSQQGQATLFMTLLAAYAVLLARYSGQDDILIGTPIAGRNRQETEELIGLFINTLVMRCDLSANPRFLDLLVQVRQRSLDAYLHQDLPFDQLIERLQLPRNLSHTPLFQVLFVLQNAPLGDLSLPGLTISPLKQESNTAKFDLTLQVIESDESLICQFKYNHDLFDTSTIQRLASHFETILRSIAQAPQQRVLELPLLTPPERQQLLLDWNATSKDYPQNRLIHQLFEDRVVEAPDALAVVLATSELTHSQTTSQANSQTTSQATAQSLTYFQLNQQANQLAHHLQRLGVKPDTLVGICVERSLEMVVGLLAILKAGGAYVPLDPTYPADRLAFMLEDAQPPVLLTQSHLLAHLPAHQATVLCLDQAELWAEMPLANPVAALMPSDLAYMIYTSGSTGRPKGAMNTHLGILNRLLWMQEAYQLSAQDRVMQKTPFSFDVSVWEFFWTLMTGAQLIVIPPEKHKDSTYLVQSIVQHGITTLHFVPSMLQLFIDEPSVTQCNSLRRVICSGEALPFALQERFFERLNAELHNLYGPTEAAVDVSYWACQPNSNRHTVPIGRPIANLQLYVLDAFLQPVPIGVAGELHIGGVGLARGYHNRLELTAEKFISHPFVADKQARLYKTGDLARFLADGTIEYLGRIDHQVKIRGFRIELGEIEAVLAALPNVREAVVLAREDVPGDKRLVAYLTLQNSVALSVTELRTLLAKSLPEYMIPTLFVTLDTLPLSPNGKVDRRALPVPSSERPELAHAYQAPQTAIERWLSTLWQQVLNLETIGTTDNFLELGGDSIKGAILINNIQQQLGEIVHVVAIFDAPTVAQMSAYLQKLYPEALARRFGEQATNDSPLHNERIDAAKVAWLRSLQSPRAALSNGQMARNKRAIFVLSPPRSGSTLLRVLLGGHPQLFAPPELELLSFATLSERKAAFAGSNRFWLEGTLRAVMQAKGCDVESAKTIMEALEAKNLTTQAFYCQLQEWLGERILVDKTPSYAMQMDMLRRAEEEFADTQYIHLVRSPYATIHSFSEAHMDQIFFRHEHSLSRRQIAELIWLVSHQNILDFLANIPSERQIRIHYEELVQSPETTVRHLCHSLGIEFQVAMLEPYQESRQRMTDGLHAESRMLGDVKFHSHKRINPEAAEQWRQHYTVDFLGDITADLAATLGYERLPAEPVTPEPVTAEPATPRLSEIASVSRQQMRGGSAGSNHFPLSFSQQRLWFLAQLSGSSKSYNIPLVLQIEGDLDVGALEASIAQVVKRHDVLRTSFPLVAGNPVQEIAADCGWHLPVIALSAAEPHPEGIPVEARVKAWIEDEVQYEFDLSQAPLLRTTLLKLNEKQYILVLVTHHTLFDGWSMAVLVNELTTFYEAYCSDNSCSDNSCSDNSCSGNPPSLPELSLQYADYALWQRNHWQPTHQQTELAYWHRQLADAPALLALPLDHPRPAMQSFAGGHLPFVIEPALYGKLKQLSQQAGTTLFMTLLSAYATLLARLSGQTDVVIGSPIANRSRQELEAMIGFFVNTLALRVRLDENPSFVELLQQVRRTTLDAFQYQQVPFEQLVEVLQPVRNLSHQPLFQVMFVLQNTPIQASEVAGLSFSPVQMENVTAKFDLTLTLSESSLNHETSLLGVWEYNSDLFEADTVERFANYFTTLLTTLSSQPDQPVLTATLLPPQQAQRLLHEWSSPQVIQRPNTTLSQLFQQQVLRNPTAIALEMGDKQVRYEELAGWVAGVAQQLQQHGVGAESLVAVCMERSIEQVVAVLAVLKAGGAYVPIDPAYPSERLDYLFADAQPLLVLTQPAFAERLSTQNAPLLVLDGFAASPAMTAASSACTQQPETLAYLIYTSGSTGQPKGVGVSQRSVCNLIAAQIENYELGTGARVYLSLSLSFDAASSHLWMALCSGATLCLAPSDGLLAGEELHHFLKQQRISHAPIPAALLALLPADDLPDLRLFITGGEACSTELVERWAGRYGFYNEYGPTEATVCSTVARCLPDGRTPSIGQAIANAQVYVLDTHLNPVPVGVTGELYIGGVGVARGYHRQAQLTAERFVPHPFSQQPGARLYKTGDLVRFRADGQLEFLGRSDQQVKLRGFRIELGEIEATLLKHEAVQDAVVLLRNDSAHSPRLVAYVTAKQRVSPALLAEQASALQQFLERHLPRHMMPNDFVLLEQFPLTLSGKIDRQALPAPESDAQNSRNYLAPRNEIEKMLAEQFAAILQLKQIGVHDDFFACGGHSLLATQLVGRIREAFAIDLPLRSFFESPTVAQIAQLIEESQVDLSGTENDPEFLAMLNQIEGLSDAEIQNLFDVQVA